MGEDQHSIALEYRKTLQAAVEYGRTDYVLARAARRTRTLITPDLPARRATPHIGFSGGTGPQPCGDRAPVHVGVVIKNKRGRRPIDLAG